LSLLAIVVVLVPGRSQGTHDIALTWTAPVTGSPTSYNVKRGVASGAEVKIASATTTSFIDTTGVAGTKYFYVVTAVNSFGESVVSNEVSAIFLGDSPGQPTGLGAVAK